MKLNNKGKVLSEILIFGAVLLVLLLVAGYFGFKYVKGQTSTSSVYSNIEMNLHTAGLKYITDKNINDNIYVSLTTLKEAGLISSLTDSNGNSCNGYITFDKVEITPYIKCDNYTTIGYNEIYE